MKFLSTNFKIIIVLFALIFNSCETSKEDKLDLEKLKAGFITPTDDNTLWCYWYWIGDDISKDGITKDLEAMKAAGIGGALIGNINPDEKDGKVPMLSEEWWSHMVHAVNEGKRIGVDIGAFNCPGWSQSGGPWVKSDMAMRYVTYSEVKLEGGKNIDVQLAQPFEEFQDTYVLAFPSIKAEGITSSQKSTKIVIKPTVKNGNNLTDGNNNSVTSFANKVGKYEVELTTKNEIVANSLHLIPGQKNMFLKAEVFAMTDGKYKKIKTFTVDRRKLTPNVGADKYAHLVISLPGVKSNRFKVIFKQLNKGNAAQQKQSWDLGELVISEASGMESFARKSLAKMHPTPFPAWNSYKWDQQKDVDASLKVGSNDVIDISDKMDASGKLSWNAPAGNWTVQRFGMTPTGTKNSPSAPQGKGYEVDKANKALAQYHYSQFIGEFLKRIPEESKSAFKYVIADSYEMGSQNWTDGYEAKFEAKFGYNPKKYLPVFTGRIVGSVEESERFLWDLRRSIADAVAYEYTGGLREASNKDNLQLWLENYGHWGFPSEFLMYGGQSDLVSGEFWNEGTLGDIECKSASSAAHIYGKNRVSAEAFTAGNRSYVRHPAMLKKRGDWSLTEGINHFVLHLYIHQPDDARVPGVNAWFSTEFNRHNTWFKKSKSYFDYLRRSQHMLQQGKYAADVCYFIGEDAPIMTGVRNPELPKGYSYDYINAEVIINGMSVKDGKLVLPDGMTYSLMVLPPFDTMRPELLEKLESLVAQGGKIYGKAPVKSPSLQNYPESDEKVKAVAAKMWGSSDAKLKSYGKGAIVDGLELQDALTKLNIDKDVDLNGQASVLWTHRTMPGMEIYFLTNQSDQVIEFSPSFRVNGMKPQLWDAVSGTMKDLPDFKNVNGRTAVPIKMEALQSWFVVFTEAENTKDVKNQNNFPETKIVQTLENSWKVDFKNKEIGPKTIVDFPSLTDWITSEDDKIKFYSGTAVYTSTFDYSAKDTENDVFIDLGKVGIMATVKINGKNIGTTWIAPFKLNANNVLKEGENTIEVEVVNVWRNRLTGDRALSKEERTTWVIIDSATKAEELITSGLLGPVTIQAAKN
ncbi:glycosyl hydrolase [Flavicella sediminum]|uniref:glycosyl hydrolase n=1 Tax=Flavicella sediminum TaxID=2585141 RepID=UPI00111FC407|nr:glycosyl hydrolase [Flavicella sediminum]